MPFDIRVDSIRDVDDLKRAIKAAERSNALRDVDMLWNLSVNISPNSLAISCIYGGDSELSLLACHKLLISIVVLLPGPLQVII